MGLGTGHGATLSVGGTGVSNIRVINSWEDSMPQVDASSLETVGVRDYVPADLAEMGAFTIEVLFDTEQPSIPALGGAPVAIIYTLKQLPGETTPANYTGTGWYSRRTSPQSQTNEIMVVEYDIQWETPPSFTPAATT